MAEPSPARFYATLVGVLLATFGVVGFFYSASFGSPGDVEDALGVFAVNGWANVLHLLTGAAGLLLAATAPRAYAKWVGATYVVLAAWGFIVGDGGTILGILPVDAESSALNLAVGGLGHAPPRPPPRGAHPQAPAAKRPKRGLKRPKKSRATA
jgi:hypothetical protein